MTSSALSPLWNQWILERTGPLALSSPDLIYPMVMRKLGEMVATKLTCHPKNPGATTAAAQLK